MIKAPRDMVIVKVIYEEKIGSIILTDYQESKKRHASFRGIVASVGPEFKYSVKTGDKILFPRGEGVEIETEEGNLTSLQAKYILAKEG